MDDSVIWTLGLAVGVALLYAGSRIRSRTHSLPRPRPPTQDGGGGG